MKTDHELELFMRRLTDAQSDVERFVMAALVSHSADVPDVVQNTNYKLILHARDYRPDCAFLPWAIAFAKNEIRAYRSKQQRERLVFDDELLDTYEHSAFGNYPNMEEHPIRVKALYACLQKLPPRERNLIHDHYLKSNSLIRLAERAHKPESTIRVQIFRARQALADCMKRFCRIDSADVRKPNASGPSSDFNDLLVRVIDSDSPEPGQVAALLKCLHGNQDNLAVYADQLDVHCLLTQQARAMGIGKKAEEPAVESKSRPGIRWLPVAAGLAVLLASGVGFAAWFSRSILQQATPRPSPGVAATVVVAAAAKEPPALSAPPTESTASAAVTAAIVTQTVNQTAEGVAVTMNKLTASVSSIAAAAALAATANGNLYYVAASGNDSADGLTPETPLLTIAAAVSKTSAGDTVLIEPGDYALTNQVTIDRDIAVLGNDEAHWGRAVRVNGQGLTRCFYLNSAAAFLGNLTVSNGYTSATQGGGIRINRGSISNCVVTCCRAVGSGESAMGGGIFVDWNTSWICSISDCEISYNETTSIRGGGIHLGPNGSLTHSFIHDNLATNTADGGGISCWHGAAASLNPVISDCVISNNIASVGGGLGDWPYRVESCQFIGNQAKSGGAFYTSRNGSDAAKAPIIFSNCCFRCNGNGEIGGAIYFEYLCTVTSLVSHCTFEENYNNTNTGWCGGAIGAPRANVALTVDACVFKNNRARYDGGALRLCETQTAPVLLRNSLIMGSYGNDGALTAYSNIVVDSCTFVSNVVYGPTTCAAGIAIHGAGAVTNCIAYDNFYTDGVTRRDIYLDSGASLEGTVFYSCFKNLSGTDYDVTAPGIGNLCAEPEFTNPAKGDFSLQGPSPCRNAGVMEPWMLLAGAADLAGFHRVSGSSVDMGAYEYQQFSGTIFTLGN